MNARTETILFSVTAALFAAVMLGGIADVAYFMGRPATGTPAALLGNGTAGAPAAPAMAVRREGAERRG